MSIPNAYDAPALRTEADVLLRVEQLVGAASNARQLWIMFVDGDDRQAPVIVPIADLPGHPHPGPLGGLVHILAGLREQLTTDLGPGSVILTLERKGRDEVLAADREWADALATACTEAGMRLRALLLSTDGGVRTLPPP